MKNLIHITYINIIFILQDVRIFQKKFWFIKYFEINLGTLFERITNTKYFILFKKLPTRYGTLKLNEEEIRTAEEKKELNEENFITFNSNNDYTIINHKLTYNISIHETYSASCLIKITIKPCYESCNKCSIENDLSSYEEQNCIECKENYYPLISKQTNCYKEEQALLNWYLDTTRGIFDFCDTNCKSCFGPSNQECLSCNYNIENPLYLYNNQCFNECPLGTFIKYILEDNYICEECYINCKTCTIEGDLNEMKFDACYDNDIKYNQNCYKINDINIKSFYEPETNEITSCFQLFNLYIKENEYECINFPTEGYYVSNEITGLISQCHSDCKTCSQSYIENNANCDEYINNELFLQEGNCVEQCSLGFYNIENKCNKCHNNCLNCFGDKILKNNGKIESMECLDCKDGMIQNEKNCFPIIYYNEDKINFDISEISQEKSEATCSFFNKDIIYGEYKCIPKSDINIDTTELVVKDNDISNNELTQSINNNNELFQQIENKPLGQVINIIEEVISNLNSGEIYQISNNNPKIKISPINYGINDEDNTNDGNSITTNINFLDCEYTLRQKNNLTNDSILTDVQIEIDNEERQSLIN